MTTEPRSNWRTPLVIMVSATLILFITFGARQNYGLFMAPISTAQGPVPASPAPAAPYTP